MWDRLEIPVILEEPGSGFSAGFDRPASPVLDRHPGDEEEFDDDIDEEEGDEDLDDDLDDRSEERRVGKECW